jgi:hypothetical protein
MTLRLRVVLLGSRFAWKESQALLTMSALQ